MDATWLKINCNCMHLFKVSGYVIRLSDNPTREIVGGMGTNSFAVRAVTDARPLTSRSATTNKPLRRANGNTAAGRRVRDLYRALLAGMSNPDDVRRAQALAAAELTVAAENARAELLAGQGDVEQIVRLENLANRAVKRLGLQAATAPQGPTLAEHLAKLARERVDDVVVDDEDENASAA
jgi:hypothetical protein